MQLNLPLHKGHILVKRGNSSMNDIYTKLVFYISLCIFFVNPESQFCLLKLLLKMYTSRFLLCLVNQHRYYLVTIHSSHYSYFTISHLFNQKLSFEFWKKRCLNFRKQLSPNASVKKLL